MKTNCHSRNDYHQFYPVGRCVALNYSATRKNAPHNQRIHLFMGQQNFYTLIRKSILSIFR